MYWMRRKLFFLKRLKKGEIRLFFEREPENGWDVWLARNFEETDGRLIDCGWVGLDVEE